MLRLLAWIDAQSLDRLDEIGLGHVMHRGDHAIGIAVHIGKRHRRIPLPEQHTGSSREPQATDFGDDLVAGLAQRRTNRTLRRRRSVSDLADLPGCRD